MCEMKILRALCSELSVAEEEKDEIQPFFFPLNNTAEWNRASSVYKLLFLPHCTTAKFIFKMYLNPKSIFNHECNLSAQIV